MFEFYITLGGEGYIVRAKSFTPADRGRTWGEPEDCRPPSDAEAEFDLLDEVTCCPAMDSTVYIYYDEILAAIEERAAERADQGEEL